MALRGDICKIFSPSMFRHYLRKKYKRSNTFAKRMEVSENTVCAWRMGKSKPTWRNLIKIAAVLNIVPRMLIVPNKRYILDRWEDHLIDYLEAPPELKHQTKTEVRSGDKEGSETHSTTKTKRELKLTAREAIELTERLGYFDEVENTPVDPTEEQHNSETDEKLKKLLLGDDG